VIFQLKKKKKKQLLREYEDFGLSALVQAYNYHSIDIQNKNGMNARGFYTLLSLVINVYTLGVLVAHYVNPNRKQRLVEINGSRVEGLLQPNKQNHY
jgi:hypothetical protein